MQKQNKREDKIKLQRAYLCTNVSTVINHRIWTNPLFEKKKSFFFSF